MLVSRRLLIASGSLMQVGEYVVVYAGQALEKMDSAGAEEILAWSANLETILRRPR